MQKFIDYIENLNNGPANIYKGDYWQTCYLKPESIEVFQQFAKQMNESNMQTEEAQQLLEVFLNADFNKRYFERQEDFFNAIRSLLNKGADINKAKFFPKRKPQCIPDYAESHLHLAMLYESTSLVDFYLSNGVDPNAGDEKFEIDIALFKMYETFIKHGADFGGNPDFIDTMLFRVTIDPYDDHWDGKHLAEEYLQMVLLNNCNFLTNYEDYMFKTKIKIDRKSRHMFVTINLWLVYLMCYCFDKKKLDVTMLDMTNFNLSPEGLTDKHITKAAYNISIFKYDKTLEPGYDPNVQYLASAISSDSDYYSDSDSDS
jgi:hypothetical protein